MSVFAIDFDGTIVQAEYPDIGELIPGAADVLRLMREHGHIIIIWTCRQGRYLKEMKAFLEENDIPYDYLNEHFPDLIRQHGYASRKIFADYYIDDRNIGLWNWAQVRDIVLKDSPSNMISTKTAVPTLLIREELK